MSDSPRSDRFSSVDDDHASFLLREEWKRLNIAISRQKGDIREAESRLQDMEKAFADVERMVERVLPGWAAGYRERQRQRESAVEKVRAQMAAAS